MDFNKHDAMIAGGVVIGLALVVVFMKGRPAVSGQTAAMGAAQETVYVPTASYNINYMDNQGTVSTVNNGGNTITTYNPKGPVHIPTPAPRPVVTKPAVPIPHPPKGPTHPVSHPAPARPTPKPVQKPTPKPPVTHHNPVKPIVKPKPAPTHKPAPVHHTPAPVHHTAPKPKPAPKKPSLLSKLSKAHYSKPKSGWDKHSVVDLLKSNGDNADFSHRKTLAAAAGIHGYKGTASQNTSLLHSLQGAGLKFH